MIPRKETRWIVVTATMSPEPMTVHQVIYRARSYGYLDAGSHHIITDDGVRHDGRPANLIAAGVRPHNDQSIVINLVGDGEFTERQLDRLSHLVRNLSETYPDATVIGYRDLPGVRNSQAPGFDVAAWWAASN